MDIDAETPAFLLGLPLIQQWPAMWKLIKLSQARRPGNWRLPVAACEAVGGTAAQAIPAVAAVACLQISIILIDDLLDEDPRGEYRRRGAAATANLAAAFQATGLEALARDPAGRDGIPDAIRLAALHNLNRMALTTALGQHWDSLNPAGEESYWRVVRTKSAPFYGTALYLGALYGGAPVSLAGHLDEWGQRYGEMVQIHDDLHDTMATPASPDWTQGRASLPLLFAQTVSHPERERFVALCQAIPEPQALGEAQAILLRCGAVSYVAHQLLHRYQAARQALASLPLAQPEALAGLLEAQVKPLRRLFQVLQAAASLPGLPAE